MVVTSAKIGVSALALTVGLAGFAGAETTPRYQQGLDQPALTGGTIRPASAADAGSQDATVLLPALKGVVVLSDPSALSARSDVAGVLAEGATVPASVLRALQGFVGKPVSLASLDEMTQAAVLAYRAEGLPIVNVVVPPQDITAGVVQVVAVVAVLGKVGVQGGSLPDQAYLSGLRLQPGERVTDGAVLDHLAWKSRRANRRVDAEYAPGAAFGQTDLTLDVTETRPTSGFVGVDTSGNGGVGDYRLFGGFAINDFGGRPEHELSGQITTSEKGFGGLAALALRYAMPLDARHDLRFSGTYSKSSAEFGAITVGSRSLTLDAGVQTLLPRGTRRGLTLSYGVAVRSSDGSVEFGAPIADKSSTLVQAYVQLGGDQALQQGSLRYDLGLWVAPGGIGSNNDDAAFDAVRAGATAQNAVLRGSLDYAVDLPKGWGVSISTSIQLANARLLPSEAFYLGGIDSVRGLDDAAASGDSGYVVQATVSAPRVEVQGVAMRPYAFVDMGAAIPKDPQTGEATARGVGAGIGMDVAVTSAATIQGSVGWPISTSNLTGQSGPHVNLRLISRF